jgi:hypothetical protein
MPSLRRPFDSIGRLRVNLRRSKPPSRCPQNPSFPLSHSAPQPVRRNTDGRTTSKPEVMASLRRQRHREPLSLLLSLSSLLRVGSGEVPTADKQRRREPFQRRVRPSVSRRAAVERLHGGALPTHSCEVGAAGTHRPTLASSGASDDDPGVSSGGDYGSER